MSESRWYKSLEKPKFDRPIKFALTAFALTGLFSFAAVRLSYQSELSNAQLEFGIQADRVQHEVERRLTLPAYGLKGGRGVFAASKSVERAEFAAYVHSRDLKVEFPGVRGIGFIQRVKRENIDQFVDIERKDDAPEFSVKTAGTALDLYVIKYIYPLDKNIPAWGFDVGSEPNRRAGVESAITSGHLTLTRRVELVQDINRSAGYLLLLPVYKNGTKPVTPDERMRDLTGLVYCPIIVSELMENLAESVDSHVDFELFDDIDTAAENMVFDADRHLENEKGAIDDSHFANRLFNTTRKIEVGGRTLALRISTNTEFEKQSYFSATRYLAIGCALLSTLASIVIWLLASARERVMRLADAMTKDLKVSKEAAEEALRENTILLNAINTHAIVSTTDRKGTIVSANEAFTKISGYSSAELIGQNHRILNSGRHPREFWTDMWRTIANGKPWHGLVCNKRKDGRLYWVESSVFPILDGEGRIDRFMSIRNDATTRVEQSAQLKQAAERLESAIDGTYDGLWDWKVGTDDVWYSERFWALLGYDKETAPPPVFASFQERLHPDDTSRVLTAIETHLECDVQYDVEYRLRHKAGDYRWFRARGDSKRDDAGKPYRMAGSLQYIHDRKLAEIQLVESEACLARAELISGVGSWRLDLQTMQPEWSPQTCRIHEVAEGARVSIEHAIDFFAPEVRSEIQSKIHACIENGNSWDLELPFITSMGKQLWVRCLGERETLNGKATRLFGTIQDVTEKKRARDEITAMNASLIEQTRIAKEMAQQAKVAADAKSLFLATMSHEIRTPMNGVIGMTDLLSGTELSEEQKDYVSSIRVSGEALLGIINDVLDFSKIEAGKIAIERISFEPVCVVEDVLDIISVHAKEKTLDLVMEVAPNVPRYCLGDATRLRQILLNLASNAIKFTQSGSVHISVSVESVDQDGVQLKFVVLDSGIGISPEAAAKLFSPFTQSDASITRRFGGTGLGLAICKRLTELMGGAIGVNSSPGKGSEFWFTCSVVAEGTAVNAPKAIGALDILIAERNANIRNGLSVQLNKWGFDTNRLCSKDDLEDALSHDRQYSLIFADHEFSESILKDKTGKYNASNTILLTPKGAASTFGKSLTKFTLATPVKVSALVAILDAVSQAEEVSIDLEKLKSVADCFSGDENERYKQVADLTLNDAHAQLAKCIAAADKQDPVALEQGSHAIKGIASELGAISLAKLAKTIMELVRNHELNNAVVLIPQLKRELEGLCKYLECRPKRGNTSLQPSKIVSCEGQKRKVLVVDDIAMNRKLLNTVLRKASCDVVEASNGIDALAILDNATFDVIFMDVMMPEMDGLEVVRRLRCGTGPNANSLVVGVSASISNFDKAKCLDAGMNSFVAKPIDRNAIVKIVADLAAIPS